MFRRIPMDYDDGYDEEDEPMDVDEYVGGTSVMYQHRRIYMLDVKTPEPTVDMKPSTSASAVHHQPFDEDDPLPNPDDLPLNGDTRFLHASLDYAQRQSEELKRDFATRKPGLIAKSRETTAFLYQRYYDEEERKRIEASKNKEVFQAAPMPNAKSSQERKRRNVDMDDDWAKRSAMHPWNAGPQLMGPGQQPGQHQQLTPLQIQQRQHAYQQHQFMMMQQHHQQMAMHHQMLQQQQHQQQQHQQPPHQQPHQHQRTTPPVVTPLLAQCLQMPSTSSAPSLSSSIPLENQLHHQQLQHQNMISNQPQPQPQQNQSPMTNGAPLQTLSQNLGNFGAVATTPPAVVPDNIEADLKRQQLDKLKHDDLVEFLAQSEFRITCEKFADLGPDCFEGYFDVLPNYASTSSANNEPTAANLVQHQNQIQRQNSHQAPPSPVPTINGPMSHHSLASPAFNNPPSISGASVHNQPMTPSAPSQAPPPPTASENPLGAPMFSSTPLPPQQQQQQQQNLRNLTPTLATNGFTNGFGGEQSEQEREAAMANIRRQQQEQMAQQQQQELQHQQQMAMHHQQMMMQQQQQQHQREMFLKQQQAAAAAAAAAQQQHAQAAHSAANGIVAPAGFPGFPSSAAAAAAAAAQHAQQAQHAHYMQQMRIQQMRFQQTGMMDPRMDPRMMAGYGMPPGQPFPPTAHPQMYHNMPPQPFVHPTN